MISEYTKSLKTYTYSLLGIHIFAFTYFFPTIVFTFVASVSMFLVLYKWVELTYQIEQANRDNLIMLISTTKNESTKQILLNELWYADLHSLGGEPIHEYRI
tara:strand:- start:4002 stop:4307 length:306 start_codon:yes stop_codon:yes gene_type:complete